MVLQPKEIDSHGCAFAHSCRVQRDILMTRFGSPLVPPPLLRALLLLLSFLLSFLFSLHSPLSSHFSLHSPSSLPRSPHSLSLPFPTHPPSSWTPYFCSLLFPFFTPELFFPHSHILPSLIPLSFQDSAPSLSLSLSLSSDRISFSPLSYKHKQTGCFRSATSTDPPPAGRRDFLSRYIYPTHFLRLAFLSLSAPTLHSNEH